MNKQKLFTRFVSLFMVAIPLMGLGQRVGDPAFDKMLDELLSHSVPEMTVATFAKTDGLIALDARSRKEFEVSHIPGAIWVGYDDFNLSSVKNVSKTSTVVVYCSVGYRSEKVAEKLLDAGFTSVSNLYGGIFEYVNQGQPLVDEQERATSRIHAFDKDWGRWVKRGLKVY